MLRDGIRDWDRIKDLLPGRIGHVGATARNNRLFIDAVLYRLRTGIPWRDLPERFGDFKNIHRRFSRWAEKGLWTNLLYQRRMKTSTGRVLAESWPPVELGGGLDPVRIVGEIAAPLCQDLIEIG